MFQSSTILRELVQFTALYKLPENGRRPKHVGAIFVYFRVNSKLLQVNKSAFVGE